MFQQAPSYTTAFVAGLLSFLTPCVLPLVPGYISFVSGVSLAELQDPAAESRWKRKLPVIFSTLVFILGFSIVFSLSGATAFAVGQAVSEYKEWLVRAAGVVIIILGLHMAGAFKIRALSFEHRFQGGTGGSLPKAFVLGLAFAFGWTPCIGPILGGIWGLAMKQETVWQALALMGFYSAGLAIPFLVTGVAVDTFFKAFDRIKHHFRKIEIGAGVLLIIIGLMMVLNQFELLRAFFQDILPGTVNEWG